MTSVSPEDPASRRGEVALAERRPSVWLYALASLPLLLGVYDLVHGTGANDPLWVRIVDVGIFPLAAYLIGRRRQHPLGIAVALSVAVLFSLSSWGFWAWAVISMATHRKWRWVWITGAVTTGSSVIATVWIRSFGLVTQDASGQLVRVTDLGLLVPVMLLIVGVAFAVLVAAGFYLGLRRALLSSLTETADSLAREHALRISQAQSEERARIAREMHDVLAHRISLVSMHAGVLAFREDLTSQEARAAAEVIRLNAAEALTELRAVLGVLRESGEAETKPQPTLADLSALLDEARSAGHQVEFEEELVDPEMLPLTTSRHAYRLLQEALTNARKHAVGAPVRVSIKGRPGDGLSIDIANPLTTKAAVPGAGLGLVGLEERAKLAGGHFKAGTQAEEFVVKGWMPWEK